jgi:hypothetical protein
MLSVGYQVNPKTETRLAQRSWAFFVGTQLFPATGLRAHLANLLRARTLNTACTNKLFTEFAFIPAA